MNKRLFTAFMVLAGMLLALAGPAPAQQSFDQTDLEGSWIIYLYGAYETKTEHMYGAFYLNGYGTLTTGSSTYRGHTGSFLAGQLQADANGAVSGYLQIETWALRMDFIRAQMDQSKTEVTGFVTGQWYPCLFRMIKASGEPAETGGGEESGEQTS